MLDVLRDRTFRHLFLAQVTALLGTGLLTVALGLMAFDLAGANASLVLGTIFTIKMVTYVTIAPVAGAFASRIDRRTMLVALDAVRAAVALALPFVTETWQVYALVLVLFAASAAFTPTFQATIPDILPEEDRYTRALSLSRLAYDIEAILSPVLAALALLVIGFSDLFFGTLAGFAASAFLILTVRLPSPKPAAEEPLSTRTTLGLRIYLATPRLRGLLALNLAAASAGAMVIVNTVVLVRGELGLAGSAVALTLAAFGIGSMTAALLLPGALERMGDRPVMLGGAALAIGSLAALAVSVMATDLAWPALLLAWAAIGLGYSAILTPSGRLLRRSARPEDRPAIFAAQFALSHACWLITYPLSGWLITTFGVIPTLFSLAVLATAGALVARTVWPRNDPQIVPHSHPELPEDHPHLTDGQPHAHDFRIDALHRHWPTRG